MTYQLSTVRTETREKVADPSYSSAEIDRAINNTQKDVFNEYQLDLMKTSQAYTVTSGVADITDGAGLPANYVEAISLRDTTVGQQGRIEFIDEEDLEALHGDYDTGAAYTLKLHYYKKPDELEVDADVPEIPSEFSEMLAAGAAYRVLQAKQAYDEAGIHENKYAELLQKFYDKYMRQPASGPARMKINRTGSPFTSRHIDSLHRIP
jgi:hypothetical protein